MIGPSHYRAMSLCLLATVVLVACTRHQFWASSTVREIEEVKRRTVPSDGSLVRESGPVRDTSSIRASGRFRRDPTTECTFNGSRINSVRIIT